MTESTSHVPAAQDALELLSEAQDEILDLFDRYDVLAADGAGSDERAALAQEICTLLSVNVEIQRELLQPAARDALADATPLDDALEAHAALVATLYDVQGGDATEPRFDAGVRVLHELFVDCMELERAQLFPALRDSTLDLEALGGELAELEERLLDADEGPGRA